MTTAARRAADELAAQSAAGQLFVIDLWDGSVRGAAHIFACDQGVAFADLGWDDPGTIGCVPDARGVAGALFLAGSWDARATHLRDDKFSVGCTSGALGKCVQAGYKPWETMADGRSGWNYHQACTRLIRADYCGDGRGQTREGVRVEIIDRLGQAEEPGTDLAFEGGVDA